MKLKMGSGIGFLVGGGCGCGSSRSDDTLVSVRVWGSLWRLRWDLESGVGEVVVSRAAEGGWGW